MVMYEGSSQQVDEVRIAKGITEDNGYKSFTKRTGDYLVTRWRRIKKDEESKPSRKGNGLTLLLV